MDRWTVKKHRHFRHRLQALTGPCVTFSYPQKFRFLVYNMERRMITLSPGLQEGKMAWKVSYKDRDIT